MLEHVSVCCAAIQDDASFYGCYENMLLTEPMLVHVAARALGRAGALVHVHECVVVYWYQRAHLRYSGMTRKRALPALPECESRSGPCSIDFNRTKSFINDV